MRKMSLQEKILLYTKKTKKQTNKHVIITTVALIILLASYLVFDNFTNHTSAEIEKDDDVILTASMVGDIMMGRHVEEIMKRRGGDYLFRAVKPYFTNSDYTTGNFEHPITLVDNYDEKADKLIHLSTSPESIKVLKDMGFSVVNLANNHTMDYLDKGFNDTVYSMDDVDIKYVGVGNNLDQLYDVDYQTINGVTIATLGFTDVYIDRVSEINSGPIPLEPDLFMPLIAEASEQADLVFVHVHWGVEYDSGVSTRQKELAKAMSDAGANVIIGHHPHVLSSFDVYNDTVIFYSLGNFIFDQGWTRNKDSALVQYSLKGDGEGRFEIIPMRIKEASPRPTNNPYFIWRITHTLTKHTSDNVNWKKEDNHIILSVDHTHLLKRE